MGIIRKEGDQAMSEAWVAHEQLEPGIFVLRIQREKALNALNGEVLDQLEGALDALENEAAARVVIVTGQGARAFAAGADIEAIHHIPNEAAARQFAVRGQRLFQRFQESRLIFIAALNGYALGGGLELAMALDMRIAAETARLGQPEINLGIIPGFGGTQRLPRLVGPSRALWMVASGEPLKAAEAAAAGLVDAVTAPDELMNECLRRARILAGKAPLALAAAKRLVVQSRDWPIDQGLAAEAEAFSALGVSADGREGTAAFLEKRPPVFRGE